MLYVKYFSRVMILICLVLINSIASASIIDKRCGKYTYRVKITKGLDAYETLFELYYKIGNQKPVLFYRAESMFNLIASCIQNADKDYLFLFKESHGGNSVPEDIYGVFDPNTKKMLIKPTDWPQGNGKQVRKILGYSLPSMAFDKRTFCCDGDQINQ